MDYYSNLFASKVSGGGGVTVEPLSVTENGTYQEEGKAYSPVSVNVSGGSSAEEKMTKDVNFFDYDGTVIESYWADEWANVDSFPETPSHEGLIAQGWNYTLSQIQTEIQDHGYCDIGQMYTTESGNTEIDIFLDDYLSPYLVLAINGSVQINWGDGSNTETVTGTGTALENCIFTNHQYPSRGEYTISIKCLDGTYTFVTPAGVISSVLEDTGSLLSVGANSISAYCGCIRRIRVGQGITSLGNYAFTRLRSLDSITLPNTVTSLGNGCLYQSAMKYVTIPNTISEIPANSFYGCRRLCSVSIPSSVTTMGDMCFSNVGGDGTVVDIAVPSTTTNFGTSVFSGTPVKRERVPASLTQMPNAFFYTSNAAIKLIIPSKITYIGNNCFYGHSSLLELHFKRTTPPSLGNSMVFSSLNERCTIYVPTGCLSAYTSATNYPKASKYTYVEE